MGTSKARAWISVWRQASALFALSLFGLLQCQVGNEPRRENYVAIKLDDSLKRYDSVEILILAAGDTSQVIGKVWAGPLANPSGIQDYRLADGEKRQLAVRVRGFDDAGNLILDMLISRQAGNQVIEHLPLPRSKPAPSVRLFSFDCNHGALIPAFDSSRYDYVVNLAYAESSLVLTAVPNHAQAVMSLGTAALLAGAPSAGLPLKVGANALSLRVAVGQESSVYTLKAIRAEFVPPDRFPPDTTHPDTVLHPIGGPVDSAFQTWKHGGYVIVNLKSLALPRKSLVRHLPLLLRLTDHNFTFSQAAAAGQDLRFVRGGRELAYEISRWDTIGGIPGVGTAQIPNTHAADIWVKVDSLPGALDTVRINMYWGNPSATPASDGALVFGSEAGHNGVWHMSESGRGLTGEYRDATGRNPGTGGNGDSRSAPTRVAGVVGYGQDFRNAKTQGTIALPNGFDPGSDSWSFQAWVQPKGFTNGVIFQKGDAQQANEQRFQILCQGEGGNQIVIARAGATIYTDIYLPTDRFTLLGIVYSAGQLEVFMNGTSFGTRQWTQGTKSEGKTVIGALTLQGDQGGYTGILDEMWIASVARPAEWMRIGFDNQKIGSTLVALLPFR